MRPNGVLVKHPKVKVTKPIKRPSRLWRLLCVTALLLLAFAGYIKGSPLIQRFALVDLTLAGAVVVAMVVVVVLLRQRLHVPAEMWFVAILWGSFLIGAAGGEPNPYTHTKVIGLFTLSLLCAVGALVLLRTERMRTAWLGGVVALGVFVAVLGTVSPDRNAALGGTFAIDGSNTISAGRATGAAVVVLFVLTLGVARHRWAAALTGVGLSLFMIVSGSRGPLLAAIVSVVVVSAFSGNTHKVKQLVLGLGVMGIAWWLANTLQLIPDKLYTLEDASSFARRALWSETLPLLFSHPLGIGWGNLYEHLSASEELNSGLVQYPHNLLLEVFSEASWVAGVTLVIVLVKVFLRQRAAATSPVEMAMLGLFVFFVQSAMVSGDVNDNRGVWVALGVGLAANATRSGVGSGSDGQWRPVLIYRTLVRSGSAEQGCRTRRGIQPEPARSLDGTSRPWPRTATRT